MAISAKLNRHEPRIAPAADEDPESTGTSSEWSTSRYGSEKSTFSSRSALMVMAEAAMSQLPATMAVPVVMASKPVPTNAISNPNSSAMAAMISTSMPTYSPPTSSSNGGYGMSEQTVSVPSSTRSDSVVSPPPQAPAINANASTSTSAALGCRVVGFLLIFGRGFGPSDRFPPA